MGDKSSRPFLAEIGREPIMGFGPKSVRTTVRFQMDIGEPILQSFPEDGTFTLHEGAGVFGSEQGWRYSTTRQQLLHSSTNRFEFWLED